MNNLIAFLGVQKDNRGLDNRRWERFRPSVSICMHDDLVIDNYYIIYQGKFKRQLDFLAKDIKKVSPNTNIIPVEMNFTDPFDPLEALEKQLEFVSSLDDKDSYIINITTGTHTNQLAWFKLVENNFIDAKLIQNFSVSKRKKEENNLSDEEYVRGYYKLIDFKLERYDRYFTLLSEVSKSSEDFLKLGINTLNQKYNEMISMIERIAVKNNHPILIDGPSGAGKTHLVKNIYQLKKSKGIVTGDFQYVNCATLRPEHAQSILFGHKKGSFTGALSNRDGLIRMADKGILFLDEVATLSLEVQGMLLDALETKSYLPMGSDQYVKSDFVLFCGTNVDLHSEVEKGNFREDLLARINLWHFTLPGLKDRKEDIGPNLDYELHKAERDIGIKVRFNNEAKEFYLKFAISNEAIWKRNFRDLTSSVVRMVTLSESGVINNAIVEQEINRLKVSWNISTADKAFKCEAYLGANIGSVSYIDLLMLEETVSVCLTSKNAAEAARRLYDSKDGDALSQNPSGRLNKYLSKYGLSFKMLHE